MMMNLAETRIWQDVSAQVETVVLDTQDAVAWIRAYKPSSTVYLLAHALDGVNWGRFNAGILTVSHDVDPGMMPLLRSKTPTSKTTGVKMTPEFQTATLQQARLFDEFHEILLWCEGKTWYKRTLTETPSPAPMAFDETHLLWGTATEWKEGNFSRLADGSQGLRHIVPLPATIDVNRRMGLRVRHYLSESPVNGIQSIGLSRLVDFQEMTEKEEPYV